MPEHKAPAPSVRPSLEIIIDPEDLVQNVIESITKFADRLID